MCRGVLEASGRAWWLLEPSLAVELRICRTMNERWYSLLEQAKMPIPDDRIQRSRQRAEALVHAADRLGLPIVRDRNGRVLAIGDRERPTSTALVEDLLRTAELGEVTYRWTSGVAHATLYGLMTQLSPVDDPEAPPGVRHGVLDA